MPCNPLLHASVLAFSTESVDKFVDKPRKTHASAWGR
jgi:hypothetical protein